MLERVGLFGVRKRINQIVEFLNESAIDIGTDWVETVEQKFDNMVHLFGMVFRGQAENLAKIKTLEARVESLEKWRTRRMALDLVRSMGKDVDDECLTHALEAVEGLDARLSTLEDALFPVEETEETSEENLPDSEEDARG